MRLSCTNSILLLMRLSGDSARVKMRNRSVHSPVSMASSSAGSGPRSLRRILEISKTKGINAIAKTSGLFNLAMSWNYDTESLIRGSLSCNPPRLEVTRQVQAFIHRCNLVAIAIEQPGIHVLSTKQSLRQSSFFILTPARVVYGRIYIGIKSIFVRL